MPIDTVELTPLQIEELEDLKRRGYSIMGAWERFSERDALADFVYQIDDNADGRDARNEAQMRFARLYYGDYVIKEVVA